MGKQKKEHEKADFAYGINGSHDLYEKLKFESKRLQDGWLVFDTFNFFLTAWYLHNEWLSKDANRPLHSLKKKGRTPPEMQTILNAFRDIAIGNKHMVLKPNNYKNKIVKDIHQPEIRDLESFMTGTPKVGVTIDSTYYPMHDLERIIMQYFDWIFNDDIPSTTFPIKILNCIKELDFQSKHLTDNK